MTASGNKSYLEEWNRWPTKTLGKDRNQHFQNNFFGNTFWMADQKNEMNVDIRYLHGILTCMIYLYYRLVSWTPEKHNDSLCDSCMHK